MVFSLNAFSYENTAHNVHCMLSLVYGWTISSIVCLVKIMMTKSEPLSLYGNLVTADELNRDRAYFDAG